MTSPLHRPSRAKSRRMVSSLSLILFTFFALICLCPAASAQDASKKSEYGTVIGIGAYSTQPLSQMCSPIPLGRFGNYVCISCLGPFSLLIMHPPVIHVLGQ